MSLINQMLRDLDARRAPAADRTQLHNVVLAPQGRPSRILPAMALAVAVLMAGGAGAWYWFAGRNQPARPPMQAAGQQVAVTPPAPVAAPAVASAQASATQSQPQVVPPAAAAPPAAVVRAESAKSKGRSASRGQAAPVSASAGLAPAARAIATAAPVQGQGAAAVSAEPSIEKRPHTPLASEAAENEYNKGVAALRRGATGEAAAAFQSALRLDASHVMARQALLSLVLREQQWGEAQKLAEEGLVAQPDQTGWAITLARLQMENGKLAEASETLARHARHADRNADYQAFHALLLQKQKRYHEACDRYIAAVTLRPGEARWWYGLGVSLEADERPQEAREAFVKARDAGNLPPELAGSLKFHLH